MKNRNFLFAAMIIVVISASSCKKDDQKAAFEKSLSAWQSYKASANNTYHYVALHDVRGIYKTETTITVVDGMITARDFIYYGYKYTVSTKELSTEVLEQWHEADAFLGTHGVEAAGLLTMDDVYEQAQGRWLAADRTKNTVFFETDNNGIISKAGYTPNSCKDDCFLGIDITSISK